jgi:hypothetical protein
METRATLAAADMLSILADWAVFLIRIMEIASSNLVPQTDCTD